MQISARWQSPVSQERNSSHESLFNSRISISQASLFWVFRCSQQGEVLSSFYNLFFLLELGFKGAPQLLDQHRAGPAVACAEPKVSWKIGHEYFAMPLL